MGPGVPSPLKSPKDLSKNYLIVNAGPLPGGEVADGHRNRILMIHWTTIFEL
jgi:hypothetical protein